MTDTMTRSGRRHRPNQCERVLRYIQEFGEITQRDAYRDIGVGHLPRRIADLKERGIPIKTETRTGTNRYGDVVHFAVYRIGGDDDDS